MCECIYILMYRRCQREFMNDTIIIMFWSRSVLLFFVVHGNSWGMKIKETTRKHTSLKRNESQCNKHFSFRFQWMIFREIFHRFYETMFCVRCSVLGTVNASSPWLFFYRRNTKIKLIHNTCTYGWMDENPA